MKEFKGRRPRRWNNTAKDCFYIHCNCNICNINKLYFEYSNLKCQMKYYVIEMFRLFGKPKRII